MADRMIYKYELVLGAESKIRMPRQAQVLHVGEQDGHLAVWVAFYAHNEQQQTTRQFSVIGTGFSVPERLMTNHVGTVQMADGGVWHVFDNGEIP